jgi:hypothetical protein
MSNDSAHVQTTLTTGGLGVVTLTRDRALNAFDQGTIVTLRLTRVRACGAVVTPAREGAEPSPRFASIS